MDRGPHGAGRAPHRVGGRAATPAIDGPDSARGLGRSPATRRHTDQDRPRRPGAAGDPRALDAPRLLRLTDRIQLAAWDEVLRRAGTPTKTAHVAQALRVTREHLSREFGAGGAPNLKRVIDLARAACAADLLGNPGYTVRCVVRILGYASPSHLAGAARRV